MSWLLLGLGLFNLAAVLCMLHPRPVKRGFVGMLAVCWFTLLGTELAWIWLALQLVLALAMAAGGALDARPGMVGLSLLILSWPVLLWKHWQGLHRARTVIESALAEGLGADFLDRVPVLVQRRFRYRVRFRDWARPLAFHQAGVERITDIPYGPHGKRQYLDIYRPERRPDAGCPVLLQVHGGAWMMGDKGQQALSLMYQMAANGWICVAANYRLSPSVGFPTHLEDCKSALCWIREHGREYGMAPEFVAVTGGSAGGHLTALMGLTANRPDLQAHHPATDTSVQACVPLYGEYDFRTSHSEYPNYQEAQQSLTENVMHVAQQDAPERWELASPITQIGEDAPPFMVIHGDKDSLLPVANARAFAQELRGVSASPVVYAEIPGAEHGFDLMRSPRTENTVDGVHRFLEWTRAAAEN